MARLSWRAAVPYLAFAIVALGVLNFLWFMAETVPLNLISSNSRVVDGHFFLWSKIRGGLVEVPESTYRWLPVHEASFFLSWPLVMGSALVLGIRIFGRQVAGTAGPTGDARRVAAVRASGPPITSARMAGSIGSVWFSRPLLRVDVHPAGIVVRPALTAERAIDAGEIREVTPSGGLGPTSHEAGGRVYGLAVREVPARVAPRGPFLTVEHEGVGMATPLRLDGGRWDVADAIQAIAREGAGRQGMPDRGEALDPSDRSDGREGLPRNVTWGGIVLGFVVTVSLILFGLTFAIPHLGPFGIFWTLGLVAIAGFNVRRLLLGRRR
ncbi:MAG TPA: hypothetical protein VFI34_08865 [Candidatus Limnocylindrales bacterium]|nr:hypothetical protein [Candidatus Limnocylindrales bacterium]